MGTKEDILNAAGVDPKLASLVDNDGNIDWESSLKLGGSTAAVAVCSAYGLAAAAPICSKVGSFLGSAVYKLAQSASDIWNSIFGGEHKIIQPDVYNCTIMVQKFFTGGADGPLIIGDSPSKYAQRMFALRTLAVTTLSMCERVGKVWPELDSRPWHDGGTYGPSGIYLKLVKLGLQVPNGIWGSKHALFSAENEGGWQKGTSPANTEYRYTDSTWALLKTLLPHEPRYWWDFYRDNQYEDPARVADIKIRIDLLNDMEKNTPAFPVGYHGAWMDNAKTDGLLAPRTYNNDESASHWLFSCSEGKILKCVKHNNKDRLRWPMPGGGYMPCGVNTVLYVASDPGLDYWCMSDQISDEQFEQVKQIWVSSLESSVQKALGLDQPLGLVQQQSRALQSRVTGLNRDGGWGAGAWLALTAGIGAVGYLGYAWKKRAWPFPKKRR